MKPICAAVALLAAVGLASAQTGPEFEVASVKAFVPGSGERGGMKGGPGTDDPTRFSWPSATLQQMLVKAYGVYPDQISGPGWIGEARYAVVANVPAGATKEQFEFMLRNLLISRFQLKLQTSTKTFTVYALSIAPGGPKLKAAASATPDEPEPQPRVPGNLALDRDGCPVLPPGRRAQVGGPSGKGVVECTTFRKYNISDLIQSLQPIVATEDGGTMADRTHIVDKTGLTGEYDFTLQFHFVFRIPGHPDPPDAGPGAGPNIFTALEKQIGLRLGKSKMPLDVITIDHAERVPTDN